MQQSLPEKGCCGMCDNVKAPCKGDAALKFPDMTLWNLLCPDLTSGQGMQPSCEYLLCGLPCPVTQNGWVSPSRHGGKLPSVLTCLSNSSMVNKTAPGELDAPQVCSGRKHSKRSSPLAQSVMVADAICPPCIIMGIKSQSEALIYKPRFRFPQTGPFFASPGRVHFPAVDTECKAISQVENTLWKYLYQPFLVDIDMDLCSTYFNQFLPEDDVLYL